MTVIDKARLLGGKARNQTLSRRQTATSAYMAVLMRQEDPPTAVTGTAAT